MKKFIMGLVIGLSLLGASTGVYAAVKTIFVRLPEGSTAYIYGDVIDKEKMNVVRFTDGKITCYSAITKVNNNVVNTSLSCVK